MQDHEICDAIHQHRCVRVWYRGGYRLIEPHAFGISEGGHPVLRAYQLSGHSHSRPCGWKLLRTEEIEEFTVQGETFTAPREGYMRNDPAMTTIYCEL